jgi:hypothetical protein
VRYVSIWVTGYAYRDKESCPVSLLRFREALEIMVKIPTK